MDLQKASDDSDQQQYARHRKGVFIPPIVWNSQALIDKKVNP
jgi:hypothetical protein